MSNIRLTYDQVVETKQVTRTSSLKGCNPSKTCEFITEVLPPLDCKEGEKIILFLKDPTRLQPERNGILVGDIIYRRYEAKKFEYFIQYSDADLAEGVLPNTLTQCDILKACCYDCTAEYSDTVTGTGGEPFTVQADTGDDFEVSPGGTLGILGGDGIETAGVNATDDVIVSIALAPGANLAFFENGLLRVGGTLFSLAADVGTIESITNGDTLSILGGTAINTTVAATDDAIIDLHLSADPGQVATIGMDGGLLVVGGAGGPLDCADIRNCINVDGFIMGDGSALTPFTVLPSTDANNTVSIGTDFNIYGQSDSLVVGANSAIGGRQYDHIDAAGNSSTIPSGFTSVLTAAGCATPGVGVNKMVRSVSLSTQQLIVDAAPEHTHVVVNGAHSGSPGTDISPAGLYSSGSSGVLIINNSNCRIIVGTIRIYWAVSAALEATGVWRFEGRLSINGGPLTLIAATQWGIYPGLTGDNWFMYAEIPTDIPVGAALSLQWDMRIQTLVSSAPGSAWNQFNSGVAYQGGTQ